MPNTYYVNSQSNPNNITLAGLQGLTQAVAPTPSPGAWDKKKLPDELAYAATMAASVVSNGLKNQTYLQYIQSQIGINYLRQLYRNGIKVWEASVPGLIPIINNQIVLPTGANQNFIASADINSGEWVHYIRNNSAPSKYIASGVTPTAGLGPMRLSGSLTVGGAVNLGSFILNSPPLDVVTPSPSPVPAPQPAPSPVPAPAPGGPSASGTTIPPANQIIDNQGGVWTVSGGVIYLNGATAGFSANVILLLWYNNKIYQENNAGGWWSWTGSTWLTESGDPRLIAPAPTPAPAPVDINAYLTNNVIVQDSTASATKLSDESRVLFAGRLKLDTRFFFVTPFYNPWMPPGYNQTLVPDGGRYGGVQWHGSWSWYGDINNIPNDGFYLPGYDGRIWFKGTVGTMAQFMILNYDKQSGWTDADYEFRPFDQWISWYRAAGKKVIFNAFANISGSPISSFSNDNPPMPAWPMPSVSTARYRDLLQRIARRAGDVILIWEGPNEPNSAANDGQGFNWANESQGYTVNMLAAQYRLMSQIIKEVLPNAVIGGPVYSDLSPGFSTNKVRTFLNASAQGWNAGYGDGTGTYGRDWLDVISHHGYRYDGQSDWPGVVASYDEFIQKIADGGAGNKPIVISEYMGDEGYNDAGGDNDKWMWFNNICTAIPKKVQVFTHFTYKIPEAWGDPTKGNVAARRAWRDSLVDWMTAQEITRISFLNNNHFRITRQDGQTRESYSF